MVLLGLVPEATLSALVATGIHALAFNWPCVTIRCVVSGSHSCPFAGSLSGPHDLHYYESYETLKYQDAEDSQSDHVTLP